MTQQIYVCNPTPHEREEGVIFGATEKAGAVKVFPRHGWHVGRVKVPAYHAGLVDVDEVAGDVFTLHPLIKGVSMFAMANGIAQDLKVLRVLLDSPGLKVLLWQGVWECGVLEVVSYCYSNQATPKVQVFWATRSVDRQTRKIDLRLGFREGKLHIYGLEPAEMGGGVKLLDRQMEDSQGSEWFGNMFYGFDGEAELSTVMAQAIAPLMARGKWDKWGPFGRKPAVGVAGRARHNHEMFLAVQAGLGDTMKHMGMIGPPYGATTGDHATYGWRHHEYSLDGGTVTMWEEFAACMRESSRPGFYFELDGEIVRADRHPQWHTWWGTTHYHHGVSPDRLGRKDDPNWTQQVWTEYDWEHMGKHVWMESGMLYGSFMMLRRMEQLTESWLAGLTLPSKVGETSLNDPGTGRAAARTSLNCAYAYLATGDRRLLDRAVARFHEVIWPKWRRQWNPADAIKPFTVFPAGGKAMPDRDCVLVVEDALLAVGLKALSEVAGGVPEIEEMAAGLAEWVTRYGYFPDGGQLASAIGLREGNIVPPDYNDRTNVSSAAGTDYRQWARGAAELAAGSTDADLRSRAELVLSKNPLHTVRWGGIVDVNRAAGNVPLRDGPEIAPADPLRDGPEIANLPRAEEAPPKVSDWREKLKTRPGAKDAELPADA